MFKIKFIFLQLFWRIKILFIVVGSKKCTFAKNLVKSGVEQRKKLGYIDQKIAN